ncbi:energy-coupling factor transporter transmembrane protein EcfT [Corynebacterium sp. ES2794-CONJ1]|uniref:energy-coupling factor transporter transmembrane component T family protein n=1 Tax=unclassified Corynebacterium TaxID=2624378 RepID=UPI002166D9C6|nr:MULTISPECIES: energy-coupling factor transporter transmembrane component T [unclassified Corynebacterium]MCS4489903.1 energy-coupling factor transporter transmembrane protein EcfT [Corynebacterium sp. ES2775-CONJ]MCS4491734.1 energy-coupling factor transporter transmembrane protein EcfT [Corynebacterium sp. ES2715-CONJ3]MCS4531839.1 energy-coupling factor transporter transmembrane protein EcfT [Corynebacterium sp. ES2730-CONJ]MCU9519235.1 energy-coupling factor transporter transmembrane prot
MTTTTTKNHDTLISRFNPVARIAAVAVFTTPLLLSVDVVSAAVALLITLIAAPFLGVPLLTLLKNARPILFLTPIAGISMALYGRPEGREYFSFFFAHVTDNSLQLAAAIMVRVLAVALPVLVMMGRIDPTALGDSLTQNLKLPHTFVIAAVAGGRLISLFQRDLETMRRSRRIRGIDNRGVLTTTIALTFGLLVLALRRGAKLATAMEARGFGRYPERTKARVSSWNPRDTLLLVGCFVASLMSLGVAIYTGSFHFLGA